MSTPMTSMPCSSQNPASFKSCATLSPVCPPMVGSTASGCSSRAIWAIDDGVSSCKYTSSAIIGSVMMVAGFEFTRITR